MITRYTLPAMAELWSEQRKFELWHEVEALVAEGWEAAGIAPGGSGLAIRAAATPTPEEVSEREATTNHDVAAFVDLLADRSGSGGPWVHYGMTSSDILDTASGRRLAEAADLLLGANRELFEVVSRLAHDHRATVMVGRTHGMWAEPTSFGLKLATWAFEVHRNQERLRRARSSVAVGKISGAVGTYAHAPPSVEDFVLTGLDLQPEPASSQVTMRDRHAELLTAVAITGASIERFATEIRHLQRSEVGEVGERFETGQKGSSAMPHKRNPILAERMTGMARLLRGYQQVGLENVALWHERDISHSSAERVVLADATTVLHYMLVRFKGLLSRLVVDEDRMRANLEATAGLAFSQAVLLALIDAGLTRDEAYRVVQAASGKAMQEKRHLRQVLAETPAVALDADALDACFSPSRFLRHSGVVFDRLAALTLS